VTTEMVAFSLIAFTVIYGVLMVADVYLLAKFGRRGPSAGDETSGEVAPAAAAAR